MNHPEKSKDIQFYLFGQVYALKKTRKKLDKSIQDELFSILPEYAVNQCIHYGYCYKARLTDESERHLRFLKDTLNKLPIESRNDILQVIQNRKTTVIAHLIQQLYQATTGENDYKSVSSVFQSQTADNAEVRKVILSKYPYAIYTQTPKGREFIFNKLFKSAMTVHVLLEKDLNAFLKQIKTSEKSKSLNVIQQVHVDVMSVVLPETIKPLTPQQIKQQEPIANVRQMNEVCLKQKQAVKE